MNDPIQKSVRIECSVEHAFRVFTEKIHLWWPGPYRAASDEKASVELEPRVGGLFYSLSEDGSRKEFGTIRTWQPPYKLVFSWAIGQSEDLETEVAVQFSKEGDFTLVELKHKEAMSKNNAWSETSPGFLKAWSAVLPAYETYIKTLKGELNEKYNYCNE